MAEFECSLSRAVLLAPHEIIIRGHCVQVEARLVDPSKPCGIIKIIDDIQSSKNYQNGEFPCERCGVLVHYKVVPLVVQKPKTRF